MHIFVVFLGPLPSRQLSIAAVWLFRPRRRLSLPPLRSATTTSSTTIVAIQEAECTARVRHRKCPKWRRCIITTTATSRDCTISLALTTTIRITRNISISISSNSSSSRRSISINGCRRTEAEDRDWAVLGCKLRRRPSRRPIRSRAGHLLWADQCPPPSCANSRCSRHSSTSSSISSSTSISSSIRIIRRSSSASIRIRSTT